MRHSPDVICSDAVRSRAFKTHLRGCMRWTVSDALELDGPDEADSDGDSVSDADESCVDG